MRILIAEDSSTLRLLLETILIEWGYEVESATDGAEALAMIQAPDAPKLAIIDWVMPGMDGLEVCQRVRAIPSSEPPYIILLTVKDAQDDIVSGLEAGANDYVVKPFDQKELRARLNVGRQMVALQRSLSERVRQLEEALAQVQRLQRLLPICCYCKKIRNDQNYWQQVDAYMAEHSNIQFTHSICPDCYEKVIKPELEALPAPTSSSLSHG